MQCRTRKLPRTHKQRQCNHNLRLTLQVNRRLPKHQTLNQQKNPKTVAVSKAIAAKIKQAREEQINIPSLRLVSLLQIISARRARKRNFKSEP